MSITNIVGASVPRLPVVIGFGSTAGVGKDFAATLIESELSNRTWRAAFANCVKEDLNEFCIRNYDFSSFTEIKAEKDIIRPLLIGHGNGMRQINPDHWIDKAFESTDFETQNSDYIIFTDVRFPNEVRRIKDTGYGNLSFYVQIYTDLVDPVIPSEVEQYPEMVSLADYFLYNPVHKPGLSPEEKRDQYVEQIRHMLNVFENIEVSRNNFWVRKYKEHVFEVRQ